MRTRIALVGIVSLAIALSGCGGDDASPTAADEASAPAPGGSGTEATIEIVDFSFQGAESVAVGAELEVINRDGVPHTWTAADRSFDSGSLRTGASFRHTFAQAGTFEFACTIHPGMTGSIDVIP